MFDFSKLKMRPRYPGGYKPAATAAQIDELEKYCGHSLPENYKRVLNDYNGSSPEAEYFDVINEDGVPGEYRLALFYYLDDNKNSRANIWWLIENYRHLMGQNALPFADDGLQQIYYLKWIDNIPQVWFLEYLDRDIAKTSCVKASFDELLESLYE